MKTELTFITFPKQAPSLWHFPVTFSFTMIFL